MTAPTTTSQPARYSTDVQLCRRCRSSFEDADPTLDVCDDCALGLPPPTPRRIPEWMRRMQAGQLKGKDLTGSVAL